MEAKQHATKSSMGQKRYQWGNQNYMETNENRNTTVQKSVRSSKSNSQREVYSNTGVLQQTKKVLN